ncbi:MAG: PaaI family thioesterase [Roseiflexaceae bacterium]|nr:PaaI family thioesterase [Roseiflexaceae bacterium]
MSDQPERTRTFSWQDPMVGAQAALTMSGLEYLQAMGRGDIPIPPIMAMLNIDEMQAEAGNVTFSVVPAEYHYNPIGVVHGGLAATLCDSAMACAVHSMLSAGVAYTTLELKINYVRPITASTGRVACTGTVIHSGSRVATAEARLVDAAGKLYAHATTTCLILKG